MKHKIVGSHTPVYEKPQGWQIGKLVNDLNVNDEGTITEIADYINSGGMYWPAEPVDPNKTKSNHNWKSQSILVFDIDDGTNPEDIKKMLINYNVPIPNIYHPTFSDTPEHRKYRLIYFLDEVLTDSIHRQELIFELYNAFNADKQTRDQARHFWPGPKGTVEIWNPKEVSAQRLYEFAGLLYAQRTGNSRRPLEPGRYRRMGDSEGWKQHDSSLQELRFLAENVNWDEIASKIKIFDDFLKGKPLKYNQAMGIYLNLQWIKGGLELYANTLDKHKDVYMSVRGTPNNNYGTPYEQFRHGIARLIKYQQHEDGIKYNPMNLNRFSPYESDWEYKNLIEAGTTKRGQVRLLTAPKELMELHEAEELMADAFREAIDGPEGIYILKCATGLGKSRLLENLRGDYTIAFPTNDLKDEIADRMQVNHSITPGMPAVSDKLQERLEYLWSIGDYVSVRRLYADIIKGRETDAGIGDGDIVNDHLNQIHTAMKADGVVLTTHSRALEGGFKAPTIIFDEDPFKYMQLSGVLYVDDIKTILTDTMLSFVGGHTYNNLEKILKFLEGANEDIIVETPKFSFGVDDIISALNLTNIKSNIPKFLTSTHFIKRGDEIKFMGIRPLPKNKKIIIMSATASKELYEIIAPGTPIKFTDISNVKHRGIIYQNTYKSFSRRSMDSSTQREIEELVKDGYNVISHKKYMDFFGDDNDMYFFNTEGYDKYYGKDLVVIGTPHANPDAYLLTASALGIKFTNTDTIPSPHYQLIQWNGMEFKFSSYDHDDLRALQLHQVESQLIQAVGRARALRTDATVIVYSNLPLQIANRISWDKHDLWEPGVATLDLKNLKMNEITLRGRQ